MRYINALINRLLEKCSDITAPSLLSITCTTKVLIWQDNSWNETGFSIERSEDNNVFAEIDTVAANVETYTDSTADSMVTYYYRIRAFDADTYSAYSNVVVCEGAEVEDINYGLLYNWYAVTDVREICPVGWHIPDLNEDSALMRYLDNDGTCYVNDAGKYLKEAGTTHWLTPNTGALNSVGFNGRGAGIRQTDGSFSDITELCWFWNSSEFGGQGDVSWLEYNSEAFTTFYGAEGVGYNKNGGLSLRPMRDATVAEQLLADGTACDDYVGNDGKIYPTVKIGTQVRLACNLAETKFRTGEAIPEVTDNDEWVAATTAALCAFNNDWTKV